MGQVNHHPTLSSQQVYALVQAPIHAWLQDRLALAELPALAELVPRIHPELHGLIHHLCMATSQGSTPEAEEAWATNLAAHLLRGNLLAALWSHLALPPPLVFKGADFLENLYGDPGIRRSVDLDILLPDPHFTTFFSRLPAHVELDPLPRYERFPSDPLHAIGIRVQGVAMDVHRALEPLHRCRMDARAVCDRSETGRLGDCSVRYPEPRDRLLLWLVNLVKGGSAPDPMALVDLAAILKSLHLLREPERWAAIIDDAQEHQLHTALLWAVLTLDESGLWPGPLPPPKDFPVPRTIHVMYRFLPRGQTSRFAPPRIYTRQLLKLTFAPRRTYWATASRLAFTSVQRLVESR